MEGLPAGQGPPAGDVLHPAAVRDQTLLSHHLIKVGRVELGEAVLLGDVNLRAESVQVRAEQFSTVIPHMVSSVTYQLPPTPPTNTNY